MTSKPTVLPTAASDVEGVHVRRETLVNVLLIIAGIVLAVALFGAGVVWHSRTAARSSVVTIPASVLAPAISKPRA